MNFVLGALNALGIGSYAPSLIVFSLLGMSPRSAFPIMMGSAAYMLPMAGIRFARANKYDGQAALGIALGGIPGVLVAAYVVKSLPLGDDPLAGGRRGAVRRAVAAADGARGARRSVSSTARRLGRRLDHVAVAQLQGLRRHRTQATAGQLDVHAFSAQAEHHCAPDLPISQPHQHSSGERVRVFEGHRASSAATFGLRPQRRDAKSVPGNSTT